MTTFGTNGVRVPVSLLRVLVDTRRSSDDTAQAQKIASPTADTIVTTDGALTSYRIRHTPNSTASAGASTAAFGERETTMNSRIAADHDPPRITSPAAR
ncbi:hypothetical protein [Nocardioides pelophilus]|uniref:hypothetical protein n=1 Tax=Nocardioides pelophilus TaxID=2172019 RepID=UPI001C7F922A|nr:hypothetical protein [Nocardioides pelophilus]